MATKKPKKPKIPAPPRRPIGHAQTTLDLLARIKKEKARRKREQDKEE